MITGCMYKGKEIKKQMGLILCILSCVTYCLLKNSFSTSWFNSVWQFQSKAWREVVSIKVKKLEILFLCNFIFIVEYYICYAFLLKKWIM